MEELKTINGTKAEKYALLTEQIKSVLAAESDPIANMANIAAMIHETFRFWWTGFYRVVGDDLVLGPFQGPLACTRIKKSRGVCGTAWLRGETVVVADVDQFPGHIACSSASRSEIVVPVFNEGKVWAVLDIDSAELNTFTQEDAQWLEQITALLSA